MLDTSFVRYLKNLLIALALLAAAATFYQFRHTTHDSQGLAEDFQTALHQQERLMRQQLDQFVEGYKQYGTDFLEDSDNLSALKNLYHRKGLVFVVYGEDQMLFWSHNTLPLNGFEPPAKASGASRKANGWYVHKSLSYENKTFAVYFHAKQAFRYQNRFLVNRFHHSLPDIESQFFLSDREDQGYPVADLDNNHLFSLVLRREAALVHTHQLLYVISLFLAISSFFVFIYFTFRYFSSLFHENKRVLAVSGFIAMVLLVRLLSFLWEIPRVFYEGRMFSPEMYATSDILPSLGDLFLNVSIITIIGYFLFYNFRNIRLVPLNKRWFAGLLSFVLFSLIYLICGLSLYLIEGLVINSHLNLDVNFIFNLDIYSLVGFMIIGLIFFAFFFFSVVLCRLAMSLSPQRSWFWSFCLASFALLMGATWIYHGITPLLWMLVIAAVVVFELDRHSEIPRKGFATLVISLFLFSIISTFALHRFNEEKDLEKRKTLILQLASEQDPVAEFLFLEIEETLFNDNQLQNLVRRDPYNEMLIYNYLQHHYFYDFWAKYDLQVTVCEPDELLLIKPYFVEMPCAMFFADYIASVGKPTISEKLIYLDNNTGRNSYITRLPVIPPDEAEYTPTYHVYIEFDAKFIARDMGFPELLIDESVDINRELINYSYATYKDGFLMNEFGPFVYSVDVSVYQEPAGDFTLFSFDGYSHLMYRKDKDNLLIISRPESTFLEAVAPFSYLFITFFVLVVIFWLLVSRQRPSQLLRMNFRRRVQYSMIAILLLSALSIGGASAWFIYNIYENKNLSFLNEKALSVLLEIEADLADERRLSPDMEFFLYDRLLSYANVFFTDINLYSPEGKLLASSRPRIFEEGLVSRLMNPLAFHAMHREQRSQFIHSERIGKLEYLSAYTPLYNRYNEILAYLNLPYFAKQGELRNEVSYFLVAFINIYLILVVLAIILALFVSNFVTKPLQLIRDNLARLQLGKTNQKISWEREDEIGSLISEYNRMIDELAVSAELLARSERETAWREMARQVAHEIKNPLTPMKLSVQYLEKAWKEKLPGWEDRLERFTKTMVEQIDNMSVIAKEFSDFAQMPASKNNLIDLRVFIPEVLELYKEPEGIDVRLKLPQGEKPMNVYVDKNQLLRVFNNLIKNAIQSYGKGETVHIEVACMRDGDEYIIELTDQGAGIAEEDKYHIFNPYYTTKAKGMGLGLSMVKNIIEGFGGRVWFRSKAGEGSVFSFSLPAGKESADY